MLSADRLHWLLAGTGGAGTLVLLAALGLRLSFLVAPALVLVGGEYAELFLLRHQTVDVRAPVYGASLLLVAELAFAALELRGGKPEPGLLARRAAFVAIVTLGGVFVGTVALAAAAVPLEGGVALQAVGVMAAVGALLLLGRLATRTR